MKMLRLKMRTLWTAFFRANPKVVWEAARLRFHSESRALGLRRDLEIHFPVPDANVPLTVRPFRPADASALLNLDTPEIGAEGIHLRLSRQQLLNAQIPTCYVAETDDGMACYMQWLFGSHQNQEIKRYFKGSFPWLKPDEALLEGAFTSEAYRGYRIMPCAMAQIASFAKNFEARTVLTFVAEDNVPSLKGCKRAGFNVHLARDERWRLFRRTVTFEVLPEDTPYPFDVAPPRAANNDRSGDGAPISPPTETT